MLLSYLIKFKWVIGVVGAIASLVTIATYLDSNGYNRALVELQTKANEEIQKATNEAVKKANAKMQKALDKQQLVHADELARVKLEREIDVKFTKVIEYVDKIQIKNECLNVNHDVMGLLKQSVIDSNSTSN